MRAGVKAALITSCAIITAAIIAFLAQQTRKESPTVSQSANNSPGAIQAGGNVNINNGLSDEGLKQIREGMLAVQREQEEKLQAKFNLGYILFTATKRNEIVPLQSPFDEIIKIDWKAGYSVTFKTNYVFLHIASLIIRPTTGGVFDHRDCTIGLLRSLIYSGGVQMNDDSSSGFNIVSKDSVMW